MSERNGSEELALIVSNGINNYGFDPEKFVAVLAREHRTLQQVFTGLCLHWIYEMARKGDSGDYDGRSEASIEAAQKIVDLLGDYGYYLPLI